MIAKVLFTSMMMLTCAAPAAFNTATAQRRDFTERDEINQTYQLPRGARVEISSIRGPVQIVTSNTATAEVQIIRSARTRDDLQYHKIEVAQVGDGLVVRGLQEPEDRRRQNIQVDHHVMLKLPRHIDLSISSISGWIKVADVDGQARVSSISGAASFGDVGGKLQLNSISGSVDIGNVGGEARVNGVSGNVRLGQVNGTLDVFSVSGAVNATVVSLSPQGILIRSVSGSVEIGLRGEVNADFKAEHFTGQVYIDVPNVIRNTEAESKDVHARIGAGGSPITISSVSGNIRLTRS